MKNLFRIGAVMMIVFFSSCRATKTIQSAMVKKDSTAILAMNSEKARLDSIEFIRQNYKQVMSHHIDFTSFSGKMDVDYEDANGKNMSFNAQVRMYKDSVIWVSITAIFGIEGLRAYITPDSVKILDKQNKVYISRSVSYLQEISALPLNLRSLQDLLIGNPMFMDSTFTSYSLAPSTISLKGSNEFFKILLTIGETDKLVMSTKLDDADELRSRTSYLDYAEYENGNGIYFPKKRTISVSEKKKLNVKLSYKQYAFNEILSFPFAVPKNYRHD
jgi:hypothetical protein